MQDIKLLKTCEHCGEHITLMESGTWRNDEDETWLVERCLSCGCHPVTEVVRVKGVTICKPYEGTAYGE